MATTLLTSPAALHRFPASKITNSNSLSQLPVKIFSASPSYFVLPSQLAGLRVNQHEFRCLNGFGSGPQSLIFGADSSQILQCVSSSSGANCDSAGEDVITLDVSGMMCGGCADSVKRILESQPQVSSASVELTTETAIVCPVSEAKVLPNWQQQLGEALAKHLTTCGFKSSIQDQCCFWSSLMGLNMLTLCFLDDHYPYSKSLVRNPYWGSCWYFPSVNSFVSYNV